MGPFQYRLQRSKSVQEINDLLSKEEKDGRIGSLREVLNFLNSIDDDKKLVDLISGGGGIEIDPTVPDWAKVDNPSATVAEIERILYLDN